MSQKHSHSRPLPGAVRCGLQNLSLPITCETVWDVYAAALIEPVEVHFQWRPQVRDPSDEMVLEAAINGRADALVTYNLKHFALAGERFKVRILRPAELLRKVRR